MTADQTAAALDDMMRVDSRESWVPEIKAKYAGPKHYRVGFIVPAVFVSAIDVFDAISYKDAVRQARSKLREAAAGAPVERACRSKKRVLRVATGRERWV